ncbi:MAG TPA: crosslink repair DNA glycosylase YcaQ family protein [Mycobacteriales bacterium]|nr:crosslink repair DNA glycosylase YcaQ family protein [Mycobacteriales bacterium]
MSLSPRQARRVALAAQGFTRRRGTGTGDARALRRLLQHTQLLQIDSVNVLQRAHYLPGWSRLGAYSTATLDAMAYRKRELFEYWGHEASLMPMELHPLMRWRMRRAEQKFETWGRLARLAQERPDYVEHVYETVRDHGSVTAGELAAEERRGTEHWGWNWTDAKVAIEFLFWAGRVATRERRNFERVYDLTERVIPATVLALPTPTEEEAHRQLLLRAARACGVGTVGDIADYFRIRNPQARPRIAELVEDGRLVEVEVHGWRHPGYAPADFVVPRRSATRALLVPFDPLIWERDRTQRLFGFRYRVEIYVPAHKRVHGYYVLPFLLGDSLVARVDLKSDRQAGLLRVQGAFAEPAAPAETADELAAELTELAAWLGLDGVTVSRRGDLAAALARALP